MSAGLAAALLRFDRRHRGAQVIDHAARVWPAALLVGGSLALIARVIGAEPCVLPALLLGAAAPLAGWWRWWGHPAPAAVTAARLDRACDAQGLVMASVLAPAPAWTTTLDEHLGRVRWPQLPWARFRLTLAAALATCGVWWVPLPTPTADALRSSLLPFTAPLHRDLLDLQPLVPPERTADWAQRLAELERHPQGGLDQATWASLDHLRHAMEQAHATAAHDLAQTLAAAELAAHDAAHTPALAAALAHLAASAPGLLPPTLEDATSAASLHEALRHAVDRGLLTAAQAAALDRHGLTAARTTATTSPAAARALARQLEHQLEARRQALGSCGTCQGTAARAGYPGAGRAGGPGTSGHSDDPESDTPITHQDRPRLAGGTVRELTPGTSSNPDGSITIATHARTAETTPAARAELAEAARLPIAAGAADTRRATVHPRLAPAVEAYFTPGPLTSP